MAGLGRKTAFFGRAGDGASQPHVKTFMPMNLTLSPANARILLALAALAVLMVLSFTAPPALA